MVMIAAFTLISVCSPCHCLHLKVKFGVEARRVPLKLSSIKKYHLPCIDQRSNSLDIWQWHWPWWCFAINIHLILHFPPSAHEWICCIIHFGIYLLCLHFTPRTKLHLQSPNAYLHLQSPRHICICNRQMQIYICISHPLTVLTLHALLFKQGIKVAIKSAQIMCISTLSPPPWLPFFSFLRFLFNHFHIFL